MLADGQRQAGRKRQEYAQKKMREEEESAEKKKQKPTDQPHHQGHKMWQSSCQILSHTDHNTQK